jgi:hypothetical protein
MKKFINIRRIKKYLMFLRHNIRQCTYIFLDYFIQVVLDTNLYYFLFSKEHCNEISKEKHYIKNDENIFKILCYIHLHFAISNGCWNNFRDKVWSSIYYIVNCFNEQKREKIKKKIKTETIKNITDIKIWE